MMIASCNGLFSCTRVDRLFNNVSKACESTCVIGSTQFSLPFGHIQQTKRDAWCRYRYQFFRMSLWESIERQTNDCTPYLVVWIIFISRGDRDLLGLPCTETTRTGVTVVWVEVDPVPGSPDDYYRNIVMEEVCIRISKQIRDSHSSIRDFVFMRIDSDDFVSRHYFPLSVAISKKWSSLNKGGAYFHYPCGLSHNLKTNETSAYIWPEPAFVFNCSPKDDLETSIWKWPHDEISRFRENRPIVTSKPMWCTSVGHGNILNVASGYFPAVLNISEIHATL
jgi:hypothetical protein